jgi:predicted ATPase/transcriptional regulator with XRE-family HTH domain
MTTGEAKSTTISGDEENFPLFFGEWLKRRRQKLDLTQTQLAKRASCSVFAIRKIEAEERRPSKQLAELLAKSLEIPSEEQTTFVKVARGELSIDRLSSPARTNSPDSQPAVRPDSTPGNLPRELTPFIGREPELSALGQLLEDAQCQLLTIVGPGGIGKTRLAVEVAHHSEDHFPDGVWFIPLVSLNSPEQIVPAIANVLDFKFQEPTNLQAQLLRYLRAKRALLVLDNAEHLLDGVGLFTEILQDCPQVKLLVTSRERLNLLSEWVFEIQGLSIPPDEHVERFDSYSSVVLFLQSARRVQAGFTVRRDEQQWVLKICQNMGGMPLGIELSAAWVRILSCEAIAREIEHNIDFLSISMRDLPERHRSLRATLDHSWNLLTAEEKLILSRLSVFRGKFSWVAARDICGASLAVLSSLRNKTLLNRTEEAHYGLHEIIRQYAALKLAEHPDEDERVKDHHALFYVQRLSEWEKALQGSRQLEIFNEMAQVIDNLSQGWQRMVTNCRPRAGKRMQFCADLLHSALFSISLFYEMRCRSLEAVALFVESVEYLKTVQGEFKATEDGSRFNSVLGHITAYLGLHHIYILQYDRSREYLEEAIQLLDNSQSKVERTQAQVMLAAAYPAQGRLLDSTVMLEQSREVFREEGQNWWYLLSTINLASHYASLGKLRESEALFQEGFRLVEPGDFRLGLPLRTDFAYVLNLQGDFDRAEQLMRDNLQLSNQFGNYRLTAQIYLDLGRVALATQRITLAEEYIQKSIDLLIEYGESRDLAMHRIYLGKCYTARPDLNAARDQFRQVIKIGQELDKVHLVYWGLANIARTYIAEGQTEKALEISLALRHCPIEFTRIQDEGVRLLADLQAALSKEQVESAMKKVDSEISPDKVVVGALAYALERV